MPFIVIISVVLLGSELTAGGFLVEASFGSNVVEYLNFLFILFVGGTWVMLDSGGKSPLNTEIETELTRRCYREQTTS